jgi:hypothetical protein
MRAPGGSIERFDNSTGTSILENTGTFSEMTGSCAYHLLPFLEKNV